jgi:putative copper resistance protein D
MNSILSTNSVITALIPIVKDLNLIAFLTAIGLLYAMGFLVPESKGALTKDSIRIRSLALLATAVWTTTVIGGFLLELDNLLGAGFLSAFSTSAIRDFIAQSSLGRDYLFQLIIGVLVLAALARINRLRGTYFALVLTVIALIAPIFQSHASNAGNHGLAIGALLFHVTFAALWVGGVIGLIVLSPATRALALPRFSSLALWSAIAVGISGLLNAWTRLNFLAGWHTLYGLLVLIKIALFIVLVAIGAKHRAHIASALSGSRQVYRLLLNESVVLIAAVALGGWLGSITPPTSPSALTIESSPAISITGIVMPPAPNLRRLLLDYSPDGTIIGILILITALYIKGVRVLTKRGDKWPVGRTVSFALSVAAVDFATSGGLGVYAHFAFSYHMIAHMILGMVAPIGFVLSAPITLALRTLPQGRTPEERGIRGTLITLIHSRYSMVITNPIVALALFDGSLFVLYMTPLFGKLMSSHSGHLFMDIHFLLAGYLFFYVIVGVDPNPKKIPHIVRIIMLFAAMAIHAFFSVALLSASSLIDGGYFASLHRPWATNLLADQHSGGAIGWAMGEIPILIALIATFIQWTRDDSREAKRSDRAADRAEAMGIDDELAQYNAYLAKLNARNKTEN